MKFQLAINMERITPDLDMREVERHTLEMVQMADEGGFAIVWAAEHHALEMTIAPNPFQILTWWAAHTSRIRLGSAVVVAAYWHPIKAAGEAALLDLYSGGGSSRNRRPAITSAVRSLAPASSARATVHARDAPCESAVAGDCSTGRALVSSRPASALPKRCKSPIRRAGSRPSADTSIRVRKRMQLLCGATRPMSEVEISRALGPHGAIRQPRRLRTCANRGTNAGRMEVASGRDAPVRQSEPVQNLAVARASKAVDLSALETGSRSAMLHAISFRHAGG